MMDDDKRQARAIDKWIIPIPLYTLVGYSGFLIMVAVAYISQAKDYEYTRTAVSKLEVEVDDLKSSRSRMDSNIATINVRVENIEKAQGDMNKKLDKLLELYSSGSDQKKNLSTTTR